MVGLLFPGQGSQVVGMGRDLAESFPEARATFHEADDVLGFALSRVAWEGPADALTATHNAQPALLTHSVAAYRVAAGRIPEVACAAGHSLGEFSAHVVAGTLSFPDALRAVRRRGELMFRSGEERPGTMAVVLGLEETAVEDACERASSPEARCVAANYNAPGQVVISGDSAAVEAAMRLAREAGARRVLPLNVSGAFHSPLMQDAQAGLAETLAAVAFARARFPVIANVSAQPVREPEEARSLLVRQLTAPVRWVECVRTMRACGVTGFLEIGPGSVLSGLAKRIDREAASAPLGTAAELAAFLA